MSDIQPYDSNLPSRLSSRTGRQVSRMVGATELAIVRIAGGAAIESARLDALHSLASQGLSSVALVTRTEIELAQMVPAAAGRLQMVAEIHSMTVAEQIAAAPRRLGCQR